MSARRFKFTVDHMVGRREVELVVTYTMTPPVAATWMQPAEGGEVEIISVTHKGLTMNLGASAMDALHEQACERSGDDWFEDQCAAAEYRVEQRADDRMIERWEANQ